MRAMKCDRCGKFYEYYESGKNLFKDAEKVNGVMLIDLDLNQNFYDRKSYDLCIDCMMKLKKFLENK